APLAPNAAAQPRLEAEARHERTLEGVGCSGLFGQDVPPCPSLPPACHALACHPTQARLPPRIARPMRTHANGKSDPRASKRARGLQTTSHACPSGSKK